MHCTRFQGQEGGQLATSIYPRRLGNLAICWGSCFVKTHNSTRQYAVDILEDVHRVKLAPAKTIFPMAQTILPTA